MRLRLGIAGAIFGLLLAPGLARAQMWVGVEAGGLSSNTEVTAGGTSIVNGLGSSGFMGGARAGYDWHFAGSPFFVGAMGWADWTNASFDIAGNPAATINDKFGGAVRAGVESKAGSKAYLLVGGEITNVSYQGVLAGANGLPTSFGGITVGGGVSMPVSSAIDLGIETRYTDNKAASVTVCCGGSASLQPRDLAVLATLTFHWGQTTFTTPASAGYAPLK